MGVTNTSLWLVRNFGLDITCVKLTPDLVNGEIMISSSIVIPLPEAADFEVRLQEKQCAKTRARRQGDRIDFDIVRAFIGAIPKGRWSSYGDVVAAGAPKAGQVLGTWLSRNETDVPPLVYRVLNRHGEVSAGSKTAEPSLPPAPEQVQAKLTNEGVSFDGNDRASQDQRWTVDDWAAVQASEPSA